MNSKMLLAIGIAAIVVVGGVVAVVALNNKDDGNKDPLAYFDEAGLKVLGNVNKDNAIDAADYEAVKKLVDDKASASDNKLADANNDDKLDELDLAVIQSVIDKQNTKIWHISYHDVDGNGTMDKELVETKYPVSATIMTGSANNFTMFYLLGITSEVKGASYGDTNDKFLYNSIYLEGSSVVKLGTSSTTIKFEDGKIGASNTISKDSVTCLVSDWNRTYIENEAAYETAGIDVVRIAAASFEPEVYTHTITLLGLLFDKAEKANSVLALYDETKTAIDNALKDLPKDKVKKAVASSMDGAISSQDSDYTAFCLAAGAEFGLKGFDFGTSTSVYVKDNLGVFDTREYNYDNIVHIRTALKYDSTPEQVASYWATYANAMNKWDKAYDGQVLVSGAIPIPCRVAFIAYALYNDVIPQFTKTWANGVLSQFEGMYVNTDMSGANTELVLTSYNFTVNVSDDVIVTHGSDVVNDGDKFPYGTKLHIEPKVVKAGFSLSADGSVIDDEGNFLVIDNIKARYVDPVVSGKLQSLASAVAANCSGNKYIQTVEANLDGDGSLTITNPGSKTTTTGVYTTKFVYCDTAAEAQTAYSGFKTTCEGKSGVTIITKDIMSGSEKVGEVTLTYLYKFATSATAQYYAYGAVNVTGYCGNYVLEYVKTMYYYNFDTAIQSMTGTDEEKQAQLDAYYQPDANALATAFQGVLATAA